MLNVVLLSSGCAHVLPANPSTSDRTCEGSATEGSGCTVVACSEKYREFLGTWTGPFASWDRELSAFRPFENTVTYAAADCLEDPGTGDRWIVGRRTDRYPAFEGLPEKVVTGLLVTGTHHDGTPFLRSVDDDGTWEYALAYQNLAASLSVWRLNVDEGGPMTFTTIDGRDWTAPDDVHRRNVTVTMTMASAGLDTVIVRGWHAERRRLLGDVHRDQGAPRSSQQPSASQAPWPRIPGGGGGDMAGDETRWEVREHGPMVQLAENLWWVSGSLPGMSLRRTMTVVRLANGDLLLYSAIAMNEEQMRALEALGRPAWLVVPNAGHRLDAPGYKARYPEIRVVAPPGGRTRVEERVAVDVLTTDVVLPGDSVRFEPLHGVDDAEVAMFVRSSDGTTLVLNDVMFNMDPKADWPGWIITRLLGSAPGPRVSRLAKWMLVKDKAALRADFERFAATPDLVRVIVAHEKVASGPDARPALLQAATYL